MGLDEGLEAEATPEAWKWDSERRTDLSPSLRWQTQFIRGLARITVQLHDVDILHARQGACGEP